MSVQLCDLLKNDRNIRMRINEKIKETSTLSGGHDARWAVLASKSLKYGCCKACLALIRRPGS